MYIRHSASLGCHGTPDFICATLFFVIFFCCCSALFFLYRCVMQCAALCSYFLFLSSIRVALEVPPPSRRHCLSAEDFPAFRSVGARPPLTLLPCTRTHTLHTFSVSLSRAKEMTNPLAYRTGGPCGIEAFTYVQYAFISSKNALIMSPSLVNVHFLTTRSPRFPSSPFPFFSRFFKFVV